MIAEAVSPRFPRPHPDEPTSEKRKFVEGHAKERPVFAAGTVRRRALR